MKARINKETTKSESKQKKKMRKNDRVTVENN